MIRHIKTLPRSAQMYLVYTLIASMYFAWPIFIAYLSQRFGIAAVGIYFTTVSLSALVFEVPTGYVADKFGRKFSVILGIALKIIAIMILVTETGVSAVVINAIMYGAGLALISGALDALLYQSVTHKEYEQTTTLSVPFYQFGLVFSALLGGYLFEFNMHLPIVAEALLLIMLIVPVLLMSRETHKASGELSITEAFASLKQIVTVKVSLIFLAAYLAYTTVMSLFLEILLERKMIELAIAPSGRGMVIAGVKIIAIFVIQSLILRRLKSVRSKAIFAFASGIIGFALLGIVETGVLFIAIYTLSNPFTMLANAIMSPIMQKLSRNKTRATDISMYSLLARLAFAAAAPIAGWHLTGHTTTGVFISCAIVLLITLPFLFKTLAWYEQN